MRSIIHEQLPLVSAIVEHEHAREIEKVSRVLDELGSQVTSLIHQDLIRGVRNPEKGRKGLSAEQVLRILVIKQLKQYSYEQLTFHLGDSTSYRRFCRIGICDKTPSKGALNRDLKRISKESLEAINKIILGYCIERKIEKGEKIRTDCTVEETNIHAPSDSSLLWDCIRVLTRIMHRVKEELMDIDFVDHRRIGKRRYRAIQHTAKESERKHLYRDLLKVTVKTANRAQKAAEELKGYKTNSIVKSLFAIELSSQLKHYVSLTLKVINQTTNRVMYGQRVESKDKIVSIFEPHTDIIIKARRETLYGHKLCLSTGRSGMVIDCAVLDGNPSDSTIAVEMIERVKETYNKYPRQVSFDGGFASQENLSTLKSLGIEDVVFNKKRSLEETQMAHSSWIYRSLTRFRAGIESTISFLKRCFGIDRCMWRGFDSFRTYTLGSVVAYNLLIIARHQLKQ